MEFVINKLYSNLSKAVSRRRLRLLALIAFSWSLYQSWRLAAFLEGNLLRKPRNLRNRYGEGTYALIIDPTSSVGRWFCIELARRGFNLILLCNDQMKVKQTVEECRRIQPNLDIKVLVFDVEKANEETYYDLMFSHIKHLNISLLIANNASKNRNYFVDTPSHKIYNSLLKECYSTLLLFRKIIPSILGRSSPSGVIIMSGYKPWNGQSNSPLNAGTTAFRHFLSRSIGMEYNNKLDVLVVNPFDIEEEKIESSNSKIIKENGSLEGSLKETMNGTANKIVNGEHTLRENKDINNKDNNILIQDELKPDSNQLLKVPKSIEKINISINGQSYNITPRSKNSLDKPNDSTSGNSGSSGKDAVKEKTPRWRRVYARAFVVSCLNKLSFEKKSYGHWKHEVAGWLN